jgi:hypothetical protein
VRVRGGLNLGTGRLAAQRGVTVEEGGNERGDVAKQGAWVVGLLGDARPAGWPAGFRTSRTKMGDLIKAGDVRLNWRAVSKTSVEVKSGDVISCSGKGRLEVRAVETTRKEKFMVTLLRYV